MTRVGGEALAVLMAVVLVVSMVGPAAAVGGASATHESQQTYQSQTAYQDHEDQFAQVADNVSIWERSVVFPFRVADSSQPVTEVQNPDLRLSHSEFGQVPIQRGSIGVFGTEQSVDLVFSSETGAPAGNFAGEQVDLLVAETELRQAESGPQRDDLRALLTGESDARYEIADSTTLGDSDELAQFSYDFSTDNRGAGDYVFFLVNNGSYTVDDGAVENVSNARVLGTDFATVQSTSSSVTTSKSEYRPGETVTVDVDSNLGSGPATHSVILFNESSLTEQSGGDANEYVELTYKGDLDSLDNATAEDFVISSSLGHAHGELSIDEGVSLFGKELDARNHQGQYDFRTVVDPLVTQFGMEGVEMEPGDNVLNMSMTAVSGTGSSTTLEVGTSRNFTDGTYDVLHIAEDEKTGKLSTNRTTVDIETAPYFEVQIDEEASDRHVSSGETANVVAEIKNEGTEGDEQAVEFLVDGAVADTKTISLKPGTAKTVNFSHETDENQTGQYNVTVRTADDEDSSTLGVSQGALFVPEIQTSNSTIDVVKGESVVIEATVENKGDQAATQDVRLYLQPTNDDSESGGDWNLRGEAKNVSLNPGKATDMTFRTETNASDVGDHHAKVVTEDEESKSAKIVVREHTNFSVAIEEIQPSDEILAGQDTVNVTATIENADSVADTQDVELRVSGVEVDSKSVKLDEGESTTIELSYATSSHDVGESNVTVASARDEATDQIEIEAPDDPQFIVDLEVDGGELVAGDNVTGTLTVRNEGDLEDTQNVTVTFAGRTILEERLTLGADENHTVESFEVETSRSDAGDQLVVAESEDDRSVQSLSLLRPSTFEVDVVESESRLNPVAGQNATVVVEVENVGEVDEQATEMITATRLDDGSSREEAVTLGSGENADLEFQFPTRDGGKFDVAVASTDDEETAEVTVEDQEAFLDVSIDTISPEVVEEPGSGEEDVEVTAEITNLGTESQTQRIEFLVDGEYRVNETVSFDGAGDQTITVEVPIEQGDAPTAEVEVQSNDAIDSEEIDVTALDEFEVTIVEASNVSEPISEEASFTPTINLTNVGAQTGNATVRVRFNETIVRNFTLDEVDGGSEVTVVEPDDGQEFAINASDPGNRLLEVEVNNTRTNQPVDDRSTRSLDIGEAANFEVTGFETPEKAVAGDEIAVDATIENTGDVNDSQTVLFEVDGEEFGSEQIELGPGKTTGVSFTYETRSRDIGNLSVGILTDDDASESDVGVLQDATFRVDEVLVDEKVIENVSFSVDVVVNNVGDVEGTDQVRLYVGGELVGTESTTVESETSTVVTFDGLTTDEVGGTEVVGVTSDDLERQFVDVGRQGELDLSIRSVSDPITTNDTFETTVRARNLGDGDVENEDVILLVEDSDGNMVRADVGTVDVAGGEAARITLTDDDVVNRSIDNETAVDFAVESADDAVGGTFTLQEPPETAFFGVSNIDAPDEVLNTSELTVTVTANVSNLGEKQDSQDVSLHVDGEEVATNEGVSIDGGERTTVDFEFDAVDIGAGRNLPVRIESSDDDATTDITITEPRPGTPNIVDVEVPEATTQEETVEVNVTVENTGDLPLDSSIEVASLSGPSVLVNETSDISLEGEQTVTETVEITPPAEARAGEFERQLRVRAVPDSEEVRSAVVYDTLGVDFEGIHSGIEAAASGGTVLVAPGTYSERNRINVSTPGVTILAASPLDPPVVESPRRDDTALEITADGVSVQNIHFLGDDTSTETAIEIDANDTTISGTRMRSWERGVYEKAGERNRIRAARIVDSGEGITLTGDGDGSVSHLSIARVDRGVLLESDRNQVMFSHIVNADTGIEIRGEDNFVFATTVRDNRFGIMPIGPGEPEEVRNRIHRSNIVSNEIGVFVDGDNVSATENYWGGRRGGTAIRGQDYVARSSIDTSNALNESVEPANFTVETATVPDEVDRNAPFSVNVTISNTGEQAGQQDVELVDGSETIDTRSVSISDNETRKVTLRYRPDLTDGESLDLRVRTNDDSTEPESVEIVDPRLDVSIKNASAAEVQAGETVEIEAEVENTATSTELEQELLLLLDGRPVDNGSVAVSAGDTVTETFEYQTGVDDVGELEFTVASHDDESEAVSINVTATPDFQVDIDESLTTTTVTAGQTLSVTADVTNIGGPGEQSVELYFDGEVVDGTSVTLDSGSTEQVVLSYETESDDVGEAIPVSVSAAGSDADENEVTVEEDDSSPGGPPGSPGRGPGGSPPVTPGPDPEPDPVPGKRVDARPNENAADVAFENVPANNRTEVELPSVVGTDETSISSIGFTTTADVPRLNMSVCACETVPDGETPALDAGDAISYVEVTVDSETTFEYGDATFTFTVAEETLEERGVEPEHVSLYRFNENAREWRQLPTEHVEDDTYTATSPGFSVFAIGTAQQDDVEVSDATVDDAETAPGEPVVVTATVENTGDEADTFTTDLTVDGEVVDTQEVTLGPGESVEVRFEQTFEEAGSYDLAVSGADAGSVTVESDDDNAPGGPVEEGLISPGVVLAVVLVLVLLTAGVAYYARESEGFDIGR